MTPEHFRAQLLSGPPARSASAVCERLLAVQGQDPRGFRLAVRARTRGLTVRDVERSLNDGTLVVTWLNRGTLHLVRAADYPLLQSLTTPQLFTGNARRLRQEGVSPDDAERAVRAVARAVSDGPCTRAQLRAAVARTKVRVEGQALVHVLFLAALRGVVVRGPMAGAEQAYVSVPEWIGAVRPPPRDVALAELARRYLRGHGPATDRDLAKWAGLPLRDARAALASARPRGGARSTAPPPPRLLGAFDPVLLGWASRDDVVGRHAADLVSGGLFRPFALVDGRAAGTWKLVDGRVVLAPFERLSDEAATALDADARDVERFLAVRT